MNSTFDRLRAMLVKDYVPPDQQFTIDTRLDDLGVDSLGAAELMFDIEDQFKLIVPSPPVAVALVTVGDVVAYIDELLTVQYPPARPDADAIQPKLQPT